ncbi:hypothetical protein CMQ_5867 [Grosmannia clavigera kw1407]|uniref:DUF3074 domain-containing protein n=1 Tax=Grosmannia clavigera (strain kw1407 / UAMH 11150) TaxID=655863 RepID=F0XIH4_GROCL|nr:uncharacterized protein CMQ_5867 [Grosmannia clavigera kw1407]EFX02506.1 hypothetical protein CMQ_5867 [Grosmannia clavigera kw1407]
MADNHLGPLLRLWGISVSQLPPLEASADDIAPFLLALLQEAVAFVDTVDDRMPTALWKPTHSKIFRGKEAGGAGKKDKVQVNILRRRVSADRLKMVAATRTAALGGVLAANAVQTILPGKNKKLEFSPSSETWFCRRSRHPNAAMAGTASWTEFRTYLKDNHAASEDDMTDNITGAREALVWPAAGLALQGAEEGGRRWSNFPLGVYEIRHKLSKPLHTRVFPVLQMTCAAVSGGSGSEGEDQIQNGNDELLVPEFLVVSVTVNNFATAPMPGEDATDVALRLSSQPGVVLGFYASVERVRLLPTGAGDNRGTGLVEWVMATTSNARGALPSMVQELAIPGEISKDVPLFFRWLQNRPRLDDPLEPAAAATENLPQAAEPAAFPFPLMDADLAAAEPILTPTAAPTIAPTATPPPLIAPADTHP